VIHPSVVAQDSETSLLHVIM